MHRKTLATLGLLTAILLAACTPSAAPPAPTEVVEEAPASSGIEVEAPTEAEPTTAPAAVVAEATESPTEEPLPVATSRGDSLIATDPATVNLASGEPQLVEFFAFW